MFPLRKGGLSSNNEKLRNIVDSNKAARAPAQSRSQIHRVAKCHRQMCRSLERVGTGKRPCFSRMSETKNQEMRQKLIKNQVVDEKEKSAGTGRCKGRLSRGTSNRSALAGGGNM